MFLHLKMSPLSPFVFLSCFAVGLASFNCLNPGYNCKNNAPCDYFGRCNCPPGFQGYDCGLDSSTISSSVDCRATCLNKGICYSSTLCYCTDGFIGSQCEIPVLSAECGLNSMKIRSFRPPSFQGEMYLRQSMFGCQLREMVTDVPGVRMYELEVPLRAISPCSLTKTMNEKTGDTVYDVDVATAHHKGLFSMSDSVHKVTCVYESRKIGENPVDVTKEMNPFQVRLTNDNNRRLQQVPRGDIFFFNVDSSGKNPDIGGTRVSYLEAYTLDQQTGMMRTLKLIENGCPVRSTIDRYGMSISNEEHSYRGFFTGRAKLESFEIIIGEPIQLDYRAQMCKRRCPQAICNSPQPLRLPRVTPFKHPTQAIDVV